MQLIDGTKKDSKILKLVTSVPIRNECSLAGKDIEIIDLFTITRNYGLKLINEKNK